MSDLKHIVESQKGLFEALRKAADGEIKVPEVKSACGVFGILIQRNDMLATRIRITGGELAVDKLLFLVKLVEKVKPGFVHFTSRQAIQVHDVTPDAAAEIVRACTENGLLFQGGGGDSLRNISSSVFAGVAPDGSADLIPYARYLTDVIFDWEEAFRLPRKFKIAFASKQDSALALRQDLGFVETRNANGKFGFKVYGGGGFGRNPALGFLLIPFIPPSRLARAARAMVELFSDHGDRTNRAAARVRYIVARLGKAGFKKLYLDYYRKLEKREFPPVPTFPSDWNAKTAVSFVLPEHTAPEDAGYKRWLRLATRKTRFKGEASVLLFIPKGILNVAGFQRLASLLDRFRIPAVRFTIEQNILIPAFPEETLPALYEALKDLPEDLIFSTFRGQLDTCIGAAVCRIGILDAPRYAAGVSEALDDYFRKHPARFTAARANTIVESLHFSGCPNSCTSHQAARFGFQGFRKKIGEALVDGFTVWHNPSEKPIGKEDPEFIPAAELPARVLSLLEEAKIL